MDALQAANIAILVGAGLVLLGIVSSLGAARFGAPLLLVFIGVGMLAGQDGPGGLVFNDYQVTYLVGSLALAVILFDGGLRTRLRTFQAVLAPSLLLSTVGVVVTAAVTGVAAWLLLDLTPLQALLLGSIVGSTDAAAVFFLLRTGGLQLQSKVGSVLEIESATNDPMAMLMTIVLVELLVAGQNQVGWDIMLRLGEQAMIGCAVGAVSGFALVTALNRVAMPNGLHPLFVVGAAVFVYAITSLMNGSGLLAVYLAGLVLANRPVRAYPSIVAFHDAASWLSQIVMFTVLGLLAVPTELIRYALPGLTIALALTFVARPVAVWACLQVFGYSLKEKAFISWVGLRGAVSIFLAAIPTLAGAPNGAAFFNVAFFVVLFSLMVQGWTLTTVARRLGMALRSIAPSVQRVEVDIPGQLEQEMVGYPVMQDSPILALARLPSWARPILVVREQEILDPATAGALRVGDYVYMLARPERVARLDRLFDDAPEIMRARAAVFGEFQIHGEAMMRDVCIAYDLNRTPEVDALSVADFIGSRLKGGARVGARVILSNATFIVRQVDNGRVTEAGLQLDELVAALVATAREKRPAGPLMDRIKGAFDGIWRRMVPRGRSGSG